MRPPAGPAGWVRPWRASATKSCQCPSGGRTAPRTPARRPGRARPERQHSARPRAVRPANPPRRSACNARSGPGCWRASGLRTAKQLRPADSPPHPVRSHSFCCCRASWGPAPSTAHDADGSAPHRAGADPRAGVPCRPAPTVHRRSPAPARARVRHRSARAAKDRPPCRPQAGSCRQTAGRPVGTPAPCSCVR
ncbi:hypothetical protein SDC9_172165 [bioreactor metagenome]|uniref:Uncharacterized protein n=1 Tax=bioreactor metagenome TaxID=1076179 RepID=A0A645GM26_9ZZZZ